MEERGSRGRKKEKKVLTELGQVSGVERRSRRDSSKIMILGARGKKKRESFVMCEKFCVREALEVTCTKHECPL